MINLLPPQQKKELLQEQRYKLFLIFGVLAIVFLIALSLSFFAIKINISSESRSEKAVISPQIQDNEAKIIEINKNFGNAGTASAEETPIPEEAGRISIKTEPPRSKVYIGDVYYGLSPLTVDIEPIVYEITIRLEGFKEKKEKVSIRKGQKTELEINMEKE